MLQHTEGIAGQLSSLFADAPVGLVVLDAERRYVMVNAALARLHGRSADELVGRRIDEVAPELAAALGPVFDRVLAGERVADVELDVGAATTRESFFPVRAADGMVIGIGGVIADVTDLRHVHDSERYLRELLGEELRAERGIADTLQRSLLPRSLPTIPGAAVAARYEAAGARFDVGGDFYDAFALPGGRWMLVVGDVCGKGPEAAGMTAMARYTLRAAAPHVDGPAELLARLNDEMLLHESGDGEEIVRFVTAAAACVQPVAGGFEARIAPPAIRTRWCSAPAGRWSASPPPARPAGSWPPRSTPSSAPCWERPTR